MSSFRGYSPEYALTAAAVTRAASLYRGLEGVVLEGISWSVATVSVFSCRVSAAVAVRRYPSASFVFALLNIWHRCCRVQCSLDLVMVAPCYNVFWTLPLLPASHIPASIY